MINKNSAVTALILIVMFVCPGIGQTVEVMSYNIKYDNVNDTVNNWNDRKAAMVDLLKKRNPEFIGMQEVLHRQLMYLNESLPDYNFIGVGRDDGKEKGEFSPILYDSTKFRLLDSNTFWLSKTPDKISVGWDAAMERICSYGLFQNKSSKRKVWVFNTHFDHIGIKARKNSAKLILKKIKQLNRQKLPVILMGDFNATTDNVAIKDLLKDGLLVDLCEEQMKTFNFWKADLVKGLRIDHIFVAPSLNKVEARVAVASDPPASDHHPVVMTIDFIMREKP